MSNKSREYIDSIICDIMLEDGPDGHIDGHEYITDFIMSLLDEKDDDWVEKYHQRVEKLKKQRDDYFNR